MTTNQQISEQTSLLHSLQDQTSILPESNYFSFSDLLFIHKSQDDDVISVGIKKLSLYLTISIVLWIITFLFIMYKIIQGYVIDEKDFLLFIPMYLGSILGIFNVVILSITVCNNPTLISRERRMFLRMHGPDSDEAQYIDYDSLPLMRRLFCWNLILLIVFIMILISQILYSMWFVYSIIGLWHALLPIIILVFLCLLYIAVVNVTNVLTTILLSLFLIQLILFTLKVTNKINTSWTIFTTPVMIIQTYLILYLLHLAFRLYYGKITFTTNQLIVYFGYLIGLIISIIAQIDIIYEEHIYSNVYVELQHLSYDSMILWSLSITIFTISGLIVMNTEANLLASSRGFELPLPLSRTNTGWEINKTGGYEYSFLFGTIVKKLPTLTYINLYGEYASNIPPRSTFTSMKPSYQNHPPALSSSLGTSSSSPFRSVDNSKRKNNPNNNVLIEVKSMEQKEIEMSSIN